MIKKEKKYYLKQKVEFKDGNFVDENTELKKLSSILDGYFKVECVEDNIKRIFWVQENNIIKK